MVVVCLGVVSWRRVSEMETVKQVVTVEVEALDLNMVPKFMHQVINQLHAGVVNGKLVAECGDQVKWTSKRVSVEL